MLTVFGYAQTAKINYDSNAKAGHYASIRGIKMYYESYGTGKPLLFLHANGMSINSFRKQIPYFPKNIL